MSLYFHGGCLWGLFDIKLDVAHDILEDPKAWNYHKVRNFRIGKKGL
jgi:hypothetical protein